MIDIFSIKDFKFPKGFEWGASTAGHQIEGDNVNSQWWHMENKRLKEGTDPQWEVSGKACNSYNMWKDDNDLLQEIGCGVYRMSVEWSRIEPNDGDFRQEEVDHYIRIFEDLKKRGIKISVTLVHFCWPEWFEKKGAFTNPIWEESLKYWERYLYYIVPKIAQYVDSWCVMNEFNLGYKESDFFYKERCVRLHARAYHIIKQYSDKPISTAHAHIQFVPKRLGDEFDGAIAKYYDVINNEFWYHAIRTGEIVFPHRDAFYDKEIKNACDYWAVNTYRRRLVDSRIESTRGKTYAFSIMDLTTRTEFYIDEFNPECIIHNLSKLRDKPVIITENGISSDKDEFRIVWILEYLTALKEAIDSGVDVRGYYYWSLLDNYEWGSYRPKFGLVDVDRANGFKRTIKPSGHFYKEIIKNNGFSQEILKKYLTEQPRI